MCVESALGVSAEMAMEIVQRRWLDWVAAPAVPGRARPAAGGSMAARNLSHRLRGPV